MPNNQLYISKKPNQTGRGGGANTFSCNMHRYLQTKKIPITSHLLFASKAVIIAFHASLTSLWLAKKRGCFIIHRLDEHFVEHEDEGRRIRHEKIKAINRFADVTVFQSEFVKNNVLPHLKSKRWTILRNGGDPSIFYDHQTERKYIGHVTNSVADKKRLDLLEKMIRAFPQESFLLVGQHAESKIPFKGYSNVTMVGPVSRDQIPHYYQQMKLLYFPSENDPCPNTAVEAVLSGVPVCYNPLGGTVELVKDCGLPLTQVEILLKEWPEFRKRCTNRQDLYFDHIAEQYLNLI